jgi:hypothetical protein
MCFGYLVRVGLCVVDAYYEQGHMFMVSDTCEFMCCGCMVLAKSMLKDPCLMGSCYRVNVCAIGSYYCIIRYHGFHCCVFGCCYGQFRVVGYVLGMLVLTHFDCIPHRMVWPNTKVFCVYFTFVERG